LPGHEAAGHLHLAELYQNWGQSSLASEHYARVLELRPDATGLALPPAEVFLKYGQSLLAAGTARRALELFERSGQTTPGTDALLCQAEALQTLGEHRQAQGLLQQILQEGAHEHEARERLAESELQRRDPSAAVAWLQPLIERRVLSSHAAFLLQRAYTDLGDEALAEQWQAETAQRRLTERRLRAWRLAQADPRSPRARTLAAYEAAAAGDWQGAGQVLALLLRQAPEAYQEDFVQQLVEAVRNRGELPQIEGLEIRD
jgi:Tfp pilus assembly protein PilF